MTNDELKKKIVEILFPVLKGSRVSCNEENACERCWFPCEIERMANGLADALIAAGLRFGENLTATFDHMAFEREHELERRLAEAEHRAEVAERALKNRAICHVLKYFPNETSGLKSCMQEVYEAWIYQAEKELAEERKDDQ